MKSKRMVAAGTVLLLLSAALLTGTGLGVAVADHNETGIIEGVVGEDTNAEEEGWIPDRATISAATVGFVDRVQAQATGLFSDPETDAAGAANELAEEYNNNSGTYEEWANTNAPISDGHDVMKIDITVDETTETVYLVSDTVENTSTGDLEYSNSEIVSDTNRSVDETVEVDGIAALNAAQELANIRESHIATGEPLSADDSELVRLGAKYGGDIETSINAGEL